MCVCVSQSDVSIASAAIPLSVFFLAFCTVPYSPLRTPRAGVSLVEVDPRQLARKPAYVRRIPNLHTYSTSTRDIAAEKGVAAAAFACLLAAIASTTQDGHAGRINESFPRRVAGSGRCRVPMQRLWRGMIELAIERSGREGQRNLTVTDARCCRFLRKGKPSNSVGATLPSFLPSIIPETKGSRDSNQTM